MSACRRGDTNSVGHLKCGGSSFDHWGSAYKKGQCGRGRGWKYTYHAEVCVLDVPGQATCHVQREGDGRGVEESI